MSTTSNQKNGKSPDATAHLLAGASAGLVSAVTLQPFDLLKTRLQQQQLTSKHEVRTSVARELKKLTEIKDLWRGTLPSTLRTSIGAGLYFTVLSKMRTNWAEYKSTKDSTLNLKSGSSVLPKLTPVENLTTGFLARALAGYITMPITIIKTRFESNLYNYNSMYEGIQGIYLDDNKGLTAKGSIRNFFKGSLATLVRDCPYAGLYVLTYEMFKNDFIPVLVPQTLGDNRSSVINSSAAVLAASTCTTITAPFDAIKTRLQLTNETSMVKAAKTLIHEDGGFRNLFRGLSLRLGRKGISAGISWCIYEELIKSSFVQKKFIKKDAPMS
ncbi:hypothetical protein SBY92_003807 [Candida maltosa Xu316]|uniref:Mitochondrial glycine transporter n=1 Tax=Candida maltosa (strain Xu316) TaxID=1245528 RepID=M3IPY3_CANMX|nr:hypothetical protein G210_0912 [Candida maltosa Xu316]